jgi:hypothetical protein
MRTGLMKISAAAFLGAATLALSATSASAWIVCNYREGVCWHTANRWVYPGAYVVVHPDYWRWGPSERFVWREHPGRGYWHGGVWVTF